MGQQPADGSPGQVGQVQPPVDRDTYNQQNQPSEQGQPQPEQQGKGQPIEQGQGQDAGAGAPGQLGLLQGDKGQLGVQPAGGDGGGAPDAPADREQLQAPEARVVPAAPDQHQAPQGQERALQPPPQDGAAAAPHEVNNDEGLIRAGPAGDHIDVDANQDEGGADYNDGRQDADAPNPNAAAPGAAGDADGDDNGADGDDHYDDNGSRNQVGQGQPDGDDDPDTALNNDPDAPALNNDPDIALNENSDAPARGGDEGDDNHYDYHDKDGRGNDDNNDRSNKDHPDVDDDQQQNALVANDNEGDNADETDAGHADENGNVDMDGNNPGVNDGDADVNQDDVDNADGDVANDGNDVANDNAAADDNNEYDEKADEDLVCCVKTLEWRNSIVTSPNIAHNVPDFVNFQIGSWNSNCREICPMKSPGIRTVILPETVTNMLFCDIPVFINLYTYPLVKSHFHTMGRMVA